MSENEDTLKYHLCCWEYEFSHTPCSGSENAHQQKSKKAWLYPMCVYTYIYVSLSQKLVVPNNWSWLDSKYTVTFQLPGHNIVYYVFIVCHYLYIYLSLFQYIHKKFIVSTTYHDIPCSNSYMLHQSRYSICLYKYIYISISLPLVYDLFITSAPLFIPLAFMYLYIYLPLADRWLTIYLSVHMYIPFYIVSPIYHYIYISISHWLTIGLYNVSPKKT